MKNKECYDGIVYSTDPNFVRSFHRFVATGTLSPAEQSLRIEVQKKGRNGKIVTLISGFKGRDAD